MTTATSASGGATSSVLDFMNKFKEEVKARSGNRTKHTKVPDGQSRWRLFPSWRDPKDPQFFHEFGMHYVKDSSGESKAVYLCTAKTFKRDCPVCEALSDAISSSSSDALTKLLGDAKASGRILFNALPISKEGKIGDTPVILELPFTSMDSICEIITESAQDDPNFNILTDAKLGTYIVVKREGTGRNTTYVITPGTKKVPLSADTLAKAYNLDEHCAQEYAEGKMKALTAVRNVAGLPAPSTKASMFVSEDIDDDVPFHETPKAGKTAAADTLDGLDDLSDSDLDDLLDSVK